MNKDHLINKDRGNRNPFKYEVSFLILDFNKPQETESILASIKHHTKFSNYEIVVLSNGGTQDYIMNFYNLGIIDKLILSKKNYGCGIGTHILFDHADSEYAIYAQNDQYMCRDFHIEELNEMKKLLQTNVKYIDLSGGAGHTDKFSERAHIMPVEIFKDNKDKGYGGPGPFEHDFCWSEEMTRFHLYEKKYDTNHNWKMLFGNNGRYTVREDAEGNIVRKDLYTGQTEKIK